LGWPQDDEELNRAADAEALAVAREVMVSPNSIAPPAVAATDPEGNPRRGLDTPSRRPPNDVSTETMGGSNRRRLIIFGVAIVAFALVALLMGVSLMAGPGSKSPPNPRATATYTSEPPSTVIVAPPKH
jgi:hypothetical protein